MCQVLQFSDNIEHQFESRIIRQCFSNKYVSDSIANNRFTEHTYMQKIFILSESQNLLKRC